MLLDIAYLTSIVYGIIQGSKGGLLTSFWSVAKTVLAVILAAKLLYIGADNIGERLIGNAPYAPLVLFLLGFFIINWFLTTISKSASEEFKITADGPASQALGVIFWIFILSLFFSAIVNFIEQTDLVSPTLFASSFVYPWIDDIYPLVQCKLQYVVPAVGSLFDAIQQMFYDISGAAKGDCCN